MAYRKLIKLANLATEVTDAIAAGSSVSTGKPTATGLSITGGAAQVGNALTLSYTYADAEGNAAGTHLFQWYRADNASGLNSAPIAGANAASYTPVSGDLGKFLRCSIIPVAATGTLQGNETFSAYTAAVIAAGAPAAVNGSWNATSSQNVTIAGQSATQTNTLSETKVNSASIIVPQAGTFKYFEFVVNNTWADVQISLRAASGAPHTQAAGVNSGAIVTLDGYAEGVNLIINGTGIDTFDPIPVGATVRFGFNGLDRVEFWVNGVQRIAPSNTIAAVNAVLYFTAYDGTTGGVRGVSGLKYTA